MPPHSATIERVGLIIKRSEPRARAVVTAIVGWMAERGIETEVIEPPERPSTEDSSAAHCDLIIVLGGDGTMLAAARAIGNRGTPVMGFNFGTLGFLTEFSGSELFRSLEEIVRGHFTVDPRVMISCSIVRDGRTIASVTALNDVVVNKSAIARIIEVDCWIDNLFVTYYRADGLIVSTPTGSTAYNLSAGGPILIPSMGAFVLNPICPHTLTNRPLVVPDSVSIDLTLRPTSEEVMVTIDGQIGYELLPGDCVRLSKSPATLNVVTPPDRNYFSVLRGKLRWGGRIEKADGD